MLGSIQPRLIRRGVSREHDCFGPYRTYEPGHAWTNHTDSWQWDVQNAIMGVAFLLALVAFLTGSGRGCGARSS